MQNDKAKQDPPASPKRPRISASDATFATILVGSNEARFVVHEELLTFNSKFFRAALTGNFKEGLEKTVKLPEESPETFEFFVHWLYYGRFPSSLHDNLDLVERWDPENWDLDGDDEPKVIALVNLYIFADKYQAPKLTRMAMDELFEHAKNDYYTCGCDDGRVFSETLIRLVFNQLPAHDKLCKFLIDAQAAWSYGNRLYGWEDEKEFALPNKYLAGLACRYAEMLCENDAFDEIDRVLLSCDYHVHDTPEEAERCGKKKRKLGQ